MQKNIKFNTSIYKKRAILKAILAFAHLARFKVKSDKDYIKVEIRKVDKKADNILVDEFSNYILGMTKKCL